MGKLGKWKHDDVIADDDVGQLRVRAACRSEARVFGTIQSFGYVTAVRIMPVGHSFVGIMGKRERERLMTASSLPFLTSRLRRVAEWLCGERTGCATDNACGLILRKL